MIFSISIPKPEDILTDGGGALAYRNYAGRIINYRRKSYFGEERLTVANGMVVQFYQVDKKGKVLAHSKMAHGWVGAWVFGCYLTLQGWEKVKSWTISEYMEMVK